MTDTDAPRGLIRSAAGRMTDAIRTGRAVLAHPRTPRMARVLAGAAFVYLASPIDLIPDWIPVLGQLDDLVVFPALIWLAWRLVPPAVRAECDRSLRPH